MNFRDATAPLGARAVAKALKRSVQTVKQMRMNPARAGYRRPPDGWERKVALLLRQRARGLEMLAEMLRDTERAPGVGGKGTYRWWAEP